MMHDLFSMLYDLFSMLFIGEIWIQDFNVN